MALAFERAVREQAKLRMALAGPSGSGKTLGALYLAQGLGGRIAVIDTERGSARLYADRVDFDVLELGAPYTPERYLEAIQAAAAGGYEVLIIDSMTHEWNGPGGILEIVDNLAKTTRSQSTYAAWNEGTARHRRFVDGMLQAPLHIIGTMRSKAAYVQTQDGNGKTQIRKVGMAPEQRDGIEFEFTLVFDLVNDGHLATPSKDRTGLFQDAVVLTPAVGEQLRAWLASGAPARPRSAAEELVAVQPGLTPQEVGRLAKGAAGVTAEPFGLMWGDAGFRGRFSRWTAEAGLDEAALEALLGSPLHRVELTVGEVTRRVQDAVRAERPVEVA